VFWPSSLVPLLLQFLAQWILSGLKQGRPCCDTNADPIDSCDCWKRPQKCLRKHIRWSRFNFFLLDCEK
jgi:hypothetical protein